MHRKPRTGTLPVLFVRLTLAAVLTVIARPAHAQFVVRTWLPWRTIQTPHFSLHYPANLEEWTQALATHVESIDSAVARAVGYAPRRRTQIVVDNPYSSPNGSAWPFLNQPTIELWATPPDPREDIGEFRDWGEMLVSHEFTHIAHLTRPSRNTFIRHLWEALPVDLGPIALNAPRWAIEGYATYVEGRVTGSGRPHGAWRAAFLREWAIEGQLPRYDQLDASGAYEGGEFAYLAGSAFLEWLAGRNGDSSLVAVWRRLTAKQSRSFDEAFAGVYGESARALYGRFTAELTQKALDAVRAAGVAQSDTGTIVQRLAWTTGDPAISRDGRFAAVVVHSAVSPARVVIWRTAPEPDTGRARRDSILLARDPADVPARSIYPPPKRAVATLRSNGGSTYDGPRFLADGRVLLWRNTARGDGTFAPDLYLWNPRNGDVRRVTHGAAVRDADPAPDGQSAVAMQCLHGWCDVVRVDLTTGAAATLLRGSPDRSFYRPRFAPDGQRILVSVHDGPRWRLAVARVGDAALRTVPGGRGNAYDAAWLDSSAVVAVSDASGIPNLVRIDVSTGRMESLTRASGAAVAPEPNPRDHSIWFLSLYSRGYDVRELEAGAPPVNAQPLAPELTPAAPLAPSAGTELSTNPAGAPKPFALGPRTFRWIPAPQTDADGTAFVLGLVSTDVIGRSQVLTRIGVGDVATWRGGTLGFTWRGMRPSITVEAFGAEQHPSGNRAGVAVGGGLDARLVGVDVVGETSLLYDTWQAHYRLAGSVGDVRLDPPGATSTRTLLGGDAAVAWTQRGARSRVTEAISASAVAGESFDRRFFRGLASFGLSTAGVMLPIEANASYGRTTVDASAFEQFALGGSLSPLLDQSLLGQRIAMPALPTAISTGASTFVYRVALDVPTLTPYLWAGSTAPVGDRFSVWHRVVGLEWSGRVPAIAVAGTPAARARIGVGESLDEPLRKRLRAYLALILNP
jgi:hypothetical protein